MFGDAEGQAGSVASFDAGGEIQLEPRLLLVDDEPRLLASLYELLRGRGYHLTTASSGSEAIAHLSSQRFDLVLLTCACPTSAATRSWTSSTRAASMPT